jgi:hypothetical protein
VGANKDECLRLSRVQALFLIILCCFCPWPAPYFPVDRIIYAAKRARKVARRAEEKIKTRPLFSIYVIAASLGPSFFQRPADANTKQQHKTALHRSHYTQMALFIHSCTHLHRGTEKNLLWPTSGRKVGFPANILYSLCTNAASIRA